MGKLNIENVDNLFNKDDLKLYANNYDDFEGQLIIMKILWYRDAMKSGLNVTIKKGSPVKSKNLSLNIYNSIRYIDLIQK